ncbi:rRNA methyltransferase 1, mitochondrial [Podarcis lilfordi]|uniref:rRNA methyltransferase 1, mitochondrial n=1 Tax=Podarcis lilfordi TaxID=74358 RepID=A0AA35LEJ9_9SAUR|nr:rRNA methyltransferase 1, mitochondrial [Podarcis lilfordi]
MVGGHFLFRRRKQQPTWVARLRERHIEHQRWHFTCLLNLASGTPQDCPAPLEPSDVSPCGENLRRGSASFLVGEELKNLSNDDFPERKRSPPQKPLPVERTKGSEILFGVAPCSLALARSKRNFFQLFLKAGKGTPSPTLEEFSRRAKDRGIPVKVVQRKVLDGLCKGGVHQGVCLEATPLRPIGWQEAPPPEAEGVGSQLLWLALEGIQDPMNLGAVLRSAHFLGVDRIVMSQRNSCPLTPVVSKASSGAMEVLDVYNTDDLQSLLKAKSEQGWEVLGTAAHTKDLDSVPTVSCLDFRWKGPAILLLGNEGYGLSPGTRSLCQRMLTIFPGRELPPGIESLNVSVAAGILLHSICSQRERDP